MSNHIYNDRFASAFRREETEDFWVPCDQCGETTNEAPGEDGHIFCDATCRELYMETTDGMRN